jgi:hypothetical protein
MKTFKVLPLIALLGTLAFTAAPAMAETETLQPWWHLRTSTRPANIEPGTATDELQQVVVEPGIQEYKLHEGGSGVFLRYFTEPSGHPGGHVELARTATALEIQAALASEEMYGTGDVEVTNWHEVEGAVVYDVRFVGRWTDLPVELININPGEDADVRVTQLALGRPDGEILVSAANVGDESVNGVVQPVTIRDDVPKGLHVVAIEGDVDENISELRRSYINTQILECSVVTVSCEFNGTPPPAEGEERREAYPSLIPPFETLQMFVAVNVEPGKNIEGENAAQVTGGGAPAASFKRPLTESSSSSQFGLDTYEMSAEEAGGGAATQAGKHPFQLTTTEEANQTTVPSPVGLPKDLHFNLPPGLLGDPSAIPRCSLKQFDTKAANSGREFFNNECPEDTVIGANVVSLRTIAPSGAGHFNVGRVASPVFNVEPAPGEPARFGFLAEGVPVLLTTKVRTGGDYGVTVSAANISQSVEFLSNEFTVWGVPGAAAHEHQRGQKSCSEPNDCSSPQEGIPPPFLSLPTSCTAKPLASSVEGDSWELPQRPTEIMQPFFNTTEMVTVAGCNQLPFQPSINVTPDSQQASKPTGLNVDVHVNQDSILNPEGLAQSAVKNIQVTLPAGVTLNPSAADGLEACSANTADKPEGRLGTPGDQIGYEGSRESPLEPGVSNPAFTPDLPGTVDAEGGGFKEALQPGQNFCPNASKIAEATIHTPLLPSNQPVKGYVYLAAPQNFAGFPQENPFRTHVAMYIVAEDPISGSLVKLPGKVELCLSAGEVIDGRTCEVAGQINSTFEDEPQLPFEDAELHFFGGERAPLASPTHCGSYTTNATYTPWSGGSPVNASSTFNITSGPNGSPCPGAALPFNASLVSDSTNVNAGSFSQLTTTLSRPDGNQSIQAVTLHYPEGLTGSLTGVELCGEAQANAGTCGPNSQIGETIVSVGVGGDPFTVTGGKAYITGPYEGAPFGLSIVNPAKAGPFDLQEGRPVVVRAKIEVNPSTAALTITTNGPTEGHAIPNIIEGFPLQIQHVNVLVNRPGFTFNPTNCTPTKVTGEIRSAEGAATQVEDPFQVTNCPSLKFAPQFSVSTNGKTSKADGASLHVTLTYPGPFTNYANIKYVKVELPKALPSRLTTLQKACLSKVFEANPASCPPESAIGTAKAVVPNIPVPLEGPVYFVSHGGEAFPSLEILLQGYGVKVILVGQTYISPAGVTSTTFNAIPDNPVTSFELTLPQKQFSALGTNKDLCDPTKLVTTKKRVKVKVHGKTKTVTRKTTKTEPEPLIMPTQFAAQNGATFDQQTVVSVTGCPKAEVAKKGKAKKVKGKKGKKK